MLVFSVVTLSHGVYKNLTEIFTIFHTKDSINNLNYISDKYKVIQNLVINRAVNWILSHHSILRQVFIIPRGLHYQFDDGFCERNF